MLKQKSYNFEILFNKISEASSSGECCEGINLEVLKEVDDDIKAIEEYTNLLKETQYQTYTRS